MASIVFIGSDLSLLEGLAQTFAAAGDRVRLAETLHDGAALAATEAPLVAVIERRIAVTALRSGPGMPYLTLAPGGSLVLYHGADDAPFPLPAALQRVTLADLTLPLERQRLVALVHTVADRAHSSGRDRQPTPPESPGIRD
jgi:hypothetical protein